jgi:hypothetical protein
VDFEQRRNDRKNGCFAKTIYIQELKKVLEQSEAKKSKSANAVTPSKQ